MIPIWLGAVPLTAILTWLAAFMVDSGVYEPSSVLLLGLGWLVVGTVATVGMTLVGGRWAQRTLGVLMITTLLAGVGRPVSTLSIAGFVLSAGALAALFSPQVGRGLRKLASADGPPARAVVLVLVALSYPLVLGLIPVRANAWTTALALLGPVVALGYSRVIPGGLGAVRLLLPAAGLGLAYPMGLAHGTVAIALSLIIGGLAWSKDVAVAFRPPVKKGTSYPIPPQLAPTEILDGAQIDETGQRR